MPLDSKPDPNFEDLLGYRDGTTITDSNADEGLLDPEDFDEAESDHLQRSQSWANNPFAKLGTIAGATAVIFILLGVVLTSIFDNGNQPVEQPIVGVPDTSEELEESDELSSEEGRLKTALALSRQAEQLEDIEILETESEAEAQPPSELPTPQPRPVPTIQRPTPRPAPRPAPQPVRRVEPRIEVRPQPRPRVESRASTPQSRPAPASQPAATAPTPAPTVDPAAEWQRLAQLGSYGQGALASNSTRPQRTTSRSSTTQPRRAESASAAQRNARQEAPILTGRPNRAIPPGTTTSGVLETPVVWEGPAQQQDKFVVRLDRPVMADNGERAFPSGTQLLATVSSVSNSGLVQMSVTQALVEQNGQQTAVSLPPGAIQIRGQSGAPLIAEKFFDPGPSVAALDTGLAILSGIGRAAELINRPERDIIITDDGIVSDSDNRDPDILAGMIEGGANVLIPEIAARNRRAVNEALSRDSLWTIEAGTPVEVFVNQKIRL
ncbi:MAG: TrbI/VirB10 family protein [Cyanophyceae cyanobacterium]